MFEKLFSYIRSNVKNAILGGVEDAQAELQARIEDREPITIEGPAAEEEPRTNGRARRRVAAK